MAKAMDFTKVEFIRKPVSWSRRVGCTLGFILWVFVMLLPCTFCALLTQGQIVVPTGSLPGQELRIWLIMDADQRGFGVSSASKRSQTFIDLSCVDTSVGFFLWEGKGESNQYCECYRQDEVSASWVPVTSSECM